MPVSFHDLGRRASVTKLRPLPRVVPGQVPVSWHLTATIHPS